MARPPRLEFSGGVYHVVVRGNERAAVFRDDEDREKYLGRELGSFLAYELIKPAAKARVELRSVMLSGFDS